VRAAATRYGKAPLPFHPETLAWFERYRWPGNIRELENTVSRAFLLGDGKEIVLHAPPLPAAPPAATPMPLNFRQAKGRAIAEFESRFLETLMGQANGNVSAAARLSGTERRHLGRLLKKHASSKP
jgi:DNA-binding NtrC family response regulator